jgi:hypothetical protein
LGTLAAAYHDSDIADAQIATSFSSSSKIQKHLTKEAMDELSTNGFVVIQNVLSKADLAAARDAANNVALSGRMKSPGGNLSSVRQDEVCFIRETDGTASGSSVDTRECNPLGSGLMHCIELLRGTAGTLTALGYTRSVDLRVPMQCQLARYKGDMDTSYVAHRDAASDSNFYEIGLLGW